MELERFWEEQRQQQLLWHDLGTLSEAERQQLLKDLLLHLHEEVSELQRTTDKSRYHLLKSVDPTEESNVAEAGVDAVKLIIAIMQWAGVDAATFGAEFDRKTQVVFQKWKWERDSMADVEVLLCDIDGVIGMYKPTFKLWAARNMPDVVLSGSDINAPALEPLKDAFHSGGGFRQLAAYPKAVATLNAWREAKPNRRLVLVTARPYRRYRRIYADTFWWCSHIGLRQDHILFEHDKAEAVRLVQPANILAHIEDRGKHALEVAATGVHVLKLPFEGPEEELSHPNITQVSGWDGIAHRLGLIPETP